MSYKKMVDDKSAGVKARGDGGASGSDDQEYENDKGKENAEKQQQVIAVLLDDHRQLYEGGGA